MGRKLKITENEKHTLEDLKNDEITEKREKLEMHTVGISCYCFVIHDSNYGIPHVMDETEYGWSSSN